MKNGSQDNKARVNHLPTGVPGLDNVLGGGLPEYSFNVIAGPPGCGKTILAHQIMFALASSERPAIYFTALGEPSLKMLRYQQQFDFFDNEKINESIHFISVAEESATGDLDKVFKRIVMEVEARAPGMVFIDSFRSVVLASSLENSSSASLQQFIQKICIQMASWQATTFLIGEYTEELDPNPVFSVADGIIWLRQSVQRNSGARKLEVIKMRGQPTSPDLHTFRINASGITVFAAPQFSHLDDTAIEWPPQKRLQMGIPELDVMLGGGLPASYSLLVSGPSGSGKSILAATFLEAGARNGETGVIAAFERRAKRARGSVIAELIESGRIGVVETNLPALSVDEIATLIMAEIQRLNATRVVIDSLSGFELTLAPTFREDFRESMARMVSALTRTGATVLMTSELEDRYTDLRFSPYSTAFLVDAIIVQRYIEIQSRLERVMAVVKVRGSAHSNELRLFTIHDDGIRIGKRLADHEGLLGGSPSRHRIRNYDDDRL